MLKRRVPVITIEVYDQR